MITYSEGIIRDMHKDLCTILLITVLSTSTKTWGKYKCQADENGEIRHFHIITFYMGITIHIFDTYFIARGTYKESGKLPKVRYKTPHTPRLFFFNKIRKQYR